LIQIQNIDHLVIRTANLEALIAFYRDVLGCEVERKLDPEVGLIQMRAGNALIDLVDANSKLGRAGGEAPGESGNNMDHFCVQIAAVSQQELLDSLHHHGVETGQFERRYGATGFGPSLYISDPDGNTVELRVEGTADGRRGEN